MHGHVLVLLQPVAGQAVAGEQLPVVGLEGDQIGFCGCTCRLGGSAEQGGNNQDRKSTRLNSSHVRISYAVFCLKKKKKSPLVSSLNRTTITPNRIVQK